jgi:deazaflavin-dependent oxidoreductase (nitroreductase family)
VSGRRNDHPNLFLAALAGEQFCYLTTMGRASGRPHEIEIWFAANAGLVYLLSELGERSDWIRNLRKEPEVRLRIGSEAFRGQARIATPGEEDLLARRLIAAKYEDWHEGESLPDWTQTATPVVIKMREGD